MIKRARRRLETLPTWATVAIATAAVFLSVPWLLRFYGAYWNAALGAGFCETFLPMR